MSRITLRNAKDGSLIAEGARLPDEDYESAVLRLFQATLGPDEPRRIILGQTVWEESRQGMVSESQMEMRDYRLLVVGPDPSFEGLNKDPLLLVRDDPIGVEPAE